MSPEYSVTYVSERTYIRKLELELEIARGFHFVSKHQGCEPIADGIALAREHVAVDVEGERCVSHVP